MKLFSWGKKRKSIPTYSEIICYPKRDALIVYFTDKSKKKFNTTSPWMKETFSDVIKWFSERGSPSFHLGYLGGGIVFSRSAIKCIEYRVDQDYFTDC